MIRPLAAATAAALLLVAAARVDPRFGWLVCAPLVAAVPRGRRGRDAAGFGAAFALEVALALHAGWLAEAAERYFALPRAAAIAAALALCTACAVPAGALLGLALRTTVLLPGAWPIAASAAAWTAWEHLTRIAFPSYPWVGLAATQAGVPSVLQTASVAGQGGLSLVLAAAGSAVGFALGARDRPDPGRNRGRAAALLFAAGLAVATPLLGTARLTAAPPASAPLCSLAAVDAEIERGDLPAADVLGRYAAASERALALGVDAIVWPESALPADPLVDADLLRRLRDLTARWRAALVTGGPRSDRGPDWSVRRYNSVFRIAASDPVGVYDKREIVPFAEDWPAFVPRPSGIEAVDIERGARAGRMQVGECEIGLLVCFEAERAALARELAVGGADAIVVASNDAELPTRAVTAEVAEARLRAVETGLPVLRAANRGQSLAIDRYGREIGRSPGGAVVLRIPPPDLAPAVRWASPLLVLCWATVGFAAIRARAP